VGTAIATSGRPFTDTLRLISTIYAADIASVPTLRWLLPLTPLLEGIVRAGTPAEPPTIVIILGPPGGGKSTHAHSLAATLGSRALVLSVPALIRRTPEVRDLLNEEQKRDVDLLVEDAWRRADRGLLGPRRYDEIVCELLATVTDRPLVLDAFPRSREVAEMFVAIPGVVQRSATIVLTMEGDDVEASVRRQVAREARRIGEAAAMAEIPVYRRRAAFYRDESRRAVDVLAAAGIPIVEVATTVEFPAAQREVLSFLGSFGAAA
jgi:adenylate kinase family enzyme